MTARSLLQQIWLNGTSWDEPVHAEILRRWEEWEEELPAVESLRFPRLIVPPGTVKMELHGFGDASEEAYGAVLYVRCETGDGTTSVHFVAGKVKVAPVKPLTIPRLELLSALSLTNFHFIILRFCERSFRLCQLEQPIGPIRKSLSIVFVPASQGTTHSSAIERVKSWRNQLRSNGATCLLSKTRPTTSAEVSRLLKCIPTTVGFVARPFYKVRQKTGQ